MACTCLYCNQSCLLCYKYYPQCLGQQLQSIHMIKCIFCTLSVCFSPHTVYFLGSNPKKYSPFPSFCYLALSAAAKSWQALECNQRCCCPRVVNLPGHCHFPPDISLIGYPLLWVSLPFCLTSWFLSPKYKVGWL